MLFRSAQAWRRAWDRVVPFFAFAPQVRKLIYTTNAIESPNSQLRKIIRTLTLLELAGKKFRAKEKPLEDYDGPVYIRKSEAELSLAQKTGQNA